MASKAAFYLVWIGKGGKRRRVKGSDTDNMRDAAEAARTVAAGKPGRSVVVLNAFTGDPVFDTRVIGVKEREQKNE